MVDSFGKQCGRALDTPHEIALKGLWQEGQDWKAKFLYLNIIEQL